MRLIFTVGLLSLLLVVSAETWEKDMSEEIYIEASSEGFTGVKLTCGKKRMVVEVNMEEDFDGIIYTRGSFMSKPKGCFYDAEEGTSHTLKIPFDKCDIKEDEDGFMSQVIVVQHDDWLIFPGDLAFSLHCKRGQAEDSSVARIGLSDPDPSSAGKSLPKHKRSTVESKGGKVVFTPDDIRPRKKKKPLQSSKNDEL